MNLLKALLLGLLTSAGQAQVAKQYQPALESTPEW